MREIRQHGSEGGGPELNRASLPLSVDVQTASLRLQAWANTTRISALVIQPIEKTTLDTAGNGQYHV